MKIELEPTGSFECVEGTQCRLRRGTSDKGVPVQAWIPLVRADHATSSPEQIADFERELREVKADRQLVSFDMRLVT